MGILKRFSKECETSDAHEDVALRTRYYKESGRKMVEEIKGLIEKIGYKVVSVSIERGEIMAQRPKDKSGLLVVSVVQLTPIKTAVDLKNSTDLFIPTGAQPKLKQEILSIYAELKKKFQEIDG